MPSLPINRFISGLLSATFRFQKILAKTAYRFGEFDSTDRDLCIIAKIF